MSMVLDLVEVAKSHSGINLANAFVKVLEDFGIEDKVCQCKGMLDCIQTYGNLVRLGYTLYSI